MILWPTISSSFLLQGLTGVTQYLWITKFVQANSFIFTYFQYFCDLVMVLQTSYLKHLHYVDFCFLVLYVGMWCADDYPAVKVRPQSGTTELCVEFRVTHQYGHG